MDIRQRLAIVYERLPSAPAAKTAEEALALICRVLEQVESEFCPVPRQNPPPQELDGRMYPPQNDSIKVRDDGSMEVKTRRHRLVLPRNGGFVIFRVAPGKRLIEEFRKGGPGS